MEPCENDIVLGPSGARRVLYRSEPAGGCLCQLVQKSATTELVKKTPEAELVTEVYPSKQ